MGEDRSGFLMYAIVGAPILRRAADMSSRQMVQGEMRVSTCTALIGATVMIWLVRQRKN